MEYFCTPFSVTELQSYEVFQWRGFGNRNKVQVFDTLQVSTILKSNLMRLYSPVDLTG